MVLHDFVCPFESVFLELALLISQVGIDFATLGFSNLWLGGPKAYQPAGSQSQEMF